MPLIDAHCHFWKLDRGDYAWLDAADVRFDTLRRDFLPADFPADVPLIVVQTVPTTEETDFLLSLPGPNIAGVVGWVDLTSDCIGGHLSDLAISPRFRGVRLLLEDQDPPDWLLTEPRPAALKALAQMQLSFDAVVTPSHLPALAEFANRNPTLSIIVDHAVRPRLARGSEGLDWLDGLTPLANQTRVHCKLAGLMTQLTVEELHDPLPVLHPVVARLLDLFGPERLIWGSNWPFVNIVGGYQRWLDLTLELLSDLSEDERAAIMGDNAARFYRVVV